MNQLADYAKQKPRSNNDDSLLGEVQRLEGIIATVKDELVSGETRCDSDFSSETDHTLLRGG